MPPIIQVSNLSKKFSISHEQQDRYSSLRDVVSGAFRRAFSRSRNNEVKPSTKEEFWALMNIDFEVHQGDRVGIIGRNGAGKSTLLKILSRITEPTTGRVTIDGRVASLLEVGTGFHPELTGRENIFLNGAILGMSRAEIRSKFEEIVAFAEIEKFLDTPVKRYSSGMYVRLAFAVAAHLEPEILIVDEVLAVGDAQFQKKCLGKMEEVSRGNGRTVLFVSHDMNSISSLCKQIIVLKNGSISYAGDVRKGISVYQENLGKYGNFMLATNSAKQMFIRIVGLTNAEGQVSSSFLYDQSIGIQFELGIREHLRADLFVLILDSSKRRICAFESDSIKEKMQLLLEPNMLVRGTYSLSVFINQPNIGRIDEVIDVCPFEIVDNGSRMLKHGNYDYGAVFGKGSWL